VTEIVLLTPDAFEAAVGELGEVLHAAVHAGASVGFLLPCPLDETVAFWRNQVPAVRAGDKHVFVAREDGRIVATTTLITGGPPNGRRRAEIAKVLTHPSARKQGLASRLMAAAEAMARADGRRVLVLDTWTGSDAERLYRALGWSVAGVIPLYAADIHGTLHPTTYMFKELPPRPETTNA
jgi:GNAT superfamily N-acetyltransferase